MTGTLRRAATVVGGTTALLVLAAGPASAHFCTLARASAQSDAGRAGSNGWTAFGDAAAQFLPDLCAEGIAHLAEAGGVTVDTPILDHSVLANGTLRNDKGQTAQGVRYLDFAAIEGAIPGAYALCLSQV